MSERPKPIRVKSVADEIIFYGGERKRKGDIFYIDYPIHFSKSGKMVMLDDEGNEIRHKGGYKEVKNSEGEVVNHLPMKGKPVVPGEEVMQPTKDEVEEAERKAAYEKELAELSKKYQKEPEKPKAKVQEVI